MRVQVRHRDPRHLSGDHLHGSEFGRDSQHRPGVERRVSRGSHRSPTGVGQSQEVVIVKCACGPEGGQFAKAMPGHHVGPEPSIAQQAEHPGAQDADGWLGVFGALKALDLECLFSGCEDRRREEDIGERRVRAVNIGPPKQFAQRRKVQRQLAAHLQILRTLAGKDRHHPSGGVDPLPLVKNPLRVLETFGGGLGAEHRDGTQQLLAGIDWAIGHKTKPGQIRRQIHRPGRLGQFGEHLIRLRASQRLDQFGAALAQGSGRGCCQNQLLGGLMDAVGLVVITGILLKHNMEVGAAKPKGADSGAARWCACGAQPGPWAGVHIQRRTLQAKLRVGRAHIDRRRQHPVVQGQGRLDQPGCSGRRLGVTNLRLHTAQGDMRLTRVALAEHVAQRLHLAQVARHRARAVGLDQTNACRRYPGAGVGSAQRTGLALGARRVNALVAPVARRANAPDHRVNPVAVAFGVGQALEHQHAQPLAHHHPVRSGVERSRRILTREGRRLTEAHVHKGRVIGIHPASQHHVAAMLGQFAQSHLERAERRRTGGVGYTIDPAQVEAIGDPPRDHIAEHTRKRVFFPADVGQLDRGDCLGNAFLAQPATAHGLLPHRVLEARDQRCHQLLPAANPQHHAGALEIVAALAAIARILKRLACGHQGQQLRDIRDLQDIRRQPKLQRVKVNIGQKPAALAVRLIRRARVRVVVVGTIPARGGDVRNAITLADDIIPVGRKMMGLGEERSHADDRDWLHNRGVIGARLHTLSSKSRKGGCQPPDGVRATRGFSPRQRHWTT